MLSLKHTNFTQMPGLLQYNGMATVWCCLMKGQVVMTVRLELLVLHPRQSLRQFLASHRWALRVPWPGFYCRYSELTISSERTCTVQRCTAINRLKVNIISSKYQALTFSTLNGAQKNYGHGTKWQNSRFHMQHLGVLRCTGNRKLCISDVMAAHHGCGVGDCSRCFTHHLTAISMVM